MVIVDDIDLNYESKVNQSVIRISFIFEPLQKKYRPDIIRRLIKLDGVHTLTRIIGPLTRMQISLCTWFLSRIQVFQEFNVD